MLFQEKLSIGCAWGQGLAATIRGIFLVHRVGKQPVEPGEQTRWRGSELQGPPKDALKNREMLLENGVNNAEVVQSPYGPLI